MKQVILLMNPYRDRTRTVVRSAMCLLREAGLEPLLCYAFDAKADVQWQEPVQLLSLNQALATAELLISFGGDGTLLYAAKHAARAQIPVLGVNVGSLGYLTELERGQLPMLSQLAQGSYRLERRMMLDVVAERNGEVLCHDLALNDAVISKCAAGGVTQLRLCCDTQPMGGISGDGLIICTPTGATGYSLSACGPVVEPCCDSLIVTPICPQGTMARSLVLEASHTLDIGIAPRRRAQLSLDGGPTIRLAPGDRVIIRRAPCEATLLRLRTRGMLDTLRQKFK